MDRRLLKAALRGDMTLLNELLQQDPNVLDGNMVDSIAKGKNLRVQIAAPQRGHLGYNGREILIAEPELVVPDFFIPKENPLHIAAEFGHVHFTREILRRKPHFARELNWEGQSPLHLASAKGHKEVVEVLLENDADACLDRDFKGRTPLHLAAMKGRIELLKVLLEAECAAAYILTKEGEPILHLCSNHNQFESLKRLLELVKDDEFVNLRDADDNTILHLVAEKDKTEVIRHLLGNGLGIHINTKNVYGFTVFDVLLENTSGVLDSWWTKSILIGAGAKIERKWLSTRPDNTKPKTVSKNKNNMFNEGLLVLAILMATVAFQTGINPPGGVWQENGLHNETITYPDGAESTSQNLVPHVVGESVFSCTHPHIYLRFCLFNSLTLISSVILVGLLVIGFNFDKWWSKLTLIVITFASVFTMFKTYQKAMVALSSADILRQLWMGSRFISWNRNGAVTVIMSSFFLIFATQVTPINIWYYFFKCTSFCLKFRKKKLSCCTRWVHE